MDLKTKRKPSGAAALGAGPGRPKGMPNKVTIEFRQTISDLLSKNAPKVETWLNQVAEGQPEHDIKPAPDKALNIMAKLAEYAAPKLNRTVIAGDQDAPLKTVIAWE